MRYDLNLSREPFRNRSLFWLGVTLAYFVVVVVGMAVVARSGLVGAEAEQLSREVAEQEQRIAELEGAIKAMREAESQAVLTPDDRLALADARTLITQKSVSWSQLLAELERYVPARSKLTSVSISSVEGSGSERVATVRISAVGKDQGEMAAMIANFDRSGGRFGAEPVEMEPADEGAEVAYTLEVQYRPGVGSVLQGPAASVTAPEGADNG